MAYSEKVIDHYEHPRNVGSFGKDEDGVGTGLVGAPACGDVMKLQIKVSPEGIIEDAKFKTFGCGSAIASSSLVTEWVKGKTLDQAVTIKNTDIAQRSGAAAGEDPLLGAGRGRDQGRHRRLPGEEQWAAYQESRGVTHFVTPASRSARQTNFGGEAAGRGSGLKIGFPPSRE